MFYFRVSDPLFTPKFATIGASGFDLYANIKEQRTLRSFERTVIPTGLFVEFPKGYELQVRPRSGLAIKNGITVLNTPGTVDSDYRGEIGVILINLDPDKPFIICRGDRIAQAVLAQVSHPDWESASVLGDTQRGSGGFGHTGV